MKNLKRYSQLFESQQELTQEQKDWLDKCTKGTWEVNPQTGLVDVKGDFVCSNQRLKDFKSVRFGSVSEDFNCFYNHITSLEGAPQSVGGSFNCSYNKLESLKGLPDGFRVGVDFVCDHNNLTSLEGAPQSAGRGFYCSYNELKSLEGLPDGFRVDGDFNFPYNNITSLEGLPDEFRVDGDFNCHNNPISERAIRGVLKRMRDKKISLEQAVAEYWRNIPQEDRVYLAKHHPTLPEKDRKIYKAIELNMKRR